MEFSKEQLELINELAQQGLDNLEYDREDMSKSEENERRSSLEELQETARENYENIEGHSIGAGSSVFVDEENKVRFDEARDIQRKLIALNQFYLDNADTEKGFEEAKYNSIDTDGHYDEILFDQVFYSNGVEDDFEFCHENGPMAEYVDPYSAVENWAKDHPNEVQEAQTYLDNEIAERNSADESEAM